MPLITWYDKANIHRQACVAVLDAYLPHGQKAKFAEKVGITAQWFTYIRQDRWSRRPDSFSMPSSSLAKHIAAHLPAPDYQRQAFYEHLMLAREAYKRASYEVQERNKTHLPLDDLLLDLQLAHSSATFSRSVQEARNQYQRVKEIGNLIIRNIHPDLYPLEYVDTCTILLDVYCVLGNHAHGLYWATLGRTLIERLESRDFKESRERFRDAQINVTRAEGIAYHNLVLPKQAKDCFDRAESLVSSHHNPDFWIAHVFRDKLFSLSITPRFTLSTAEML